MRKAGLTTADLLDKLEKFYGKHSRSRAPRFRRFTLGEVERLRSLVGHPEVI